MRTFLPALLLAVAAGCTSSSDPADPTTDDVDRDGIANIGDNCVVVANASQLDTDGDGKGDACECYGVVCAPLGTCRAAGACSPTTGACSDPVAPDGTPCADADACTSGETCMSGVCAGGAWACTPITERVSVTVTGGEASGASGRCSLSSTGAVVAFESTAFDLVAGDTNNLKDVFVRDRTAGTTELVSVGLAGAAANGVSKEPSVSADGRYVAFESEASNLVDGDGNLYADIFVRDRTLGTTVRASVTSAGGEAADYSEGGTISGNGRYVAFHTMAALVPEDDNGVSDVYVRDLVAGTIVQASVASDGGQANDSSQYPSLSADGRYVAFESWATNLVADDLLGWEDVFVRDLETGTTVRASVDSAGDEADDDSVAAAISGNGAFVAFDSWYDFVPDDLNFSLDVFVRDLAGGATERASVDAQGGEGDSSSHDGVLTFDGARLAFWSVATNLVAGDTNALYDIFVRDRTAGTTVRVSVAAGGAQSNGDSTEACVSSGGAFVGFTSLGDNLVAGDLNSSADVFVRSLAP